MGLKVASESLLFLRKHFVSAETIVCVCVVFHCKIMWGL